MKQLILPLKGLSSEAIEGIIDDACQHGCNRDDIRLVDGLVTVTDYPLPETDKCPYNSIEQCTDDADSSDECPHERCRFRDK
jgi:hypothetical protein